FCMELASIDPTPPRTFDLGEKRNKAAGIGFVFTAALLPSSGLRSRSQAQDVSLAVTHLSAHPTHEPTNKLTDCQPGFRRKRIIGREAHNDAQHQPDRRA